MRLAVWKLLISAAAVVAASGCAGVEPPMNDQRFASVATGMTGDEVRERLGVPLRTMAFPLSASEAWDYEGTDTWGYKVNYSVTFGPDKRVASKNARRMNDGGDFGGK